MYATVQHLIHFHTLYPHLRMEMRMHSDEGQAFAAPKLGFIADGEFITTAEALARDAMAPIDAHLLEALNYSNTPTDRAVAVADLDLALVTLQQRLLLPGDGAALYFGGKDRCTNTQWLTLPRDERRAVLLTWLQHESRHLDPADRRRWARADAAHP